MSEGARSSRLARGLSGAARILRRIAQSARNELRGETYRDQRCSTLLYAADADRGMVVDGRRFAHILDSYWELTGDRQAAITVPPIGSSFTGRSAYGRVLAPSLAVTLADIAGVILDKLLKGGGKWRARNERAYYERLLTATGCEKVIGIQPPEALVELCGKLGRPVHDLQHGVISVGNAYYERLGRSSSNLRFLVWDEETREALERDLSVPPQRIEVVGNPWLQLYRQPPPRFRDLFEVERNRAKAVLAPAAAEPVVLVTLQWGMSEYYPAEFDHPVFPPGLTGAIESSRNVLWWLRPHPMMVDRGEDDWRRIAGQFHEGANVRLCHPHEHSLPVALDLVDGHVTWDSSTVIEAVQSGVPSLILCNRPHAQLGAEGVVRPTAGSKLPYIQYRHTGLVSWAACGGSKKDEIIRFVSKLVTRKF